jgi:eukaryotic-like serine/threonine-protein kinase
MANINGYKLTGTIGEGGMATVYRGVQVSLNRPVAVKVLSQKLAQHSDILDRFLRESQIIAHINHPNIIHVIDRGITAEGMPYFVMEYVEGTDLTVALQTGALEFARKCELAVQICKALSYAHKNGVVHRDLKPANILIDTEDNARLLDFGIAQFYEDDDACGKTRTGLVMGTMPYMSPEQQVSSARVTFRSDIYSLGAVMYELFTGTKPLGRFNVPTDIVPSLPRPLEDLILRCMEADPDKRPCSADSIKDELLMLLHGAHLATAQKERASQGFASVKDKYALLDVITENRYGAVYLFEEKADHRLLVIRKRSSAGSGYTEAKLLTSLKHPNIVNVMGASRNEQIFIVVMEYLSGGSLNERLVKPHDVPAFVKTAREICAGMAFAHRNRIIHGNLRPSNILFSPSGQAAITDFGLEEHYVESRSDVNWYNAFREPRSIRADIFAAGIIFHQMLTGSLPPGVTKTPLRTPDTGTVPLELQELVSSMIARNPDARPVNFDAILQDLDTLASGLMHAAPGSTASGADPTDYLEREAGSAKPVARAGPLRRRRGLWPAVLLLVLLAATLIYGINGGHLDRILAFLGHLWQAAAASTDAFINDTLRPFLDGLQQRLRDVLEHSVRPFVQKASDQLRNLLPP